VYEKGLENASAVEQATIPVERATGPLLLISGGDDKMWPADRMCKMVVERMRRHRRADEAVHLNYPAAGHSLFPSRLPSSSGPRDPRDPRDPRSPFDLGGSREADRAAHADAWAHVVAHLRRR
jgi:dienelactone hydrolase